MRVGIIGLLHESNTFLPARTTLSHFKQDTLLVGEAVRERFAGAMHEIGGFFSLLQSEGIEAVPIFVARAIPFGPIDTESFDQLLAMLRSELARSGKLDGVLVAPHGATVCESIPDADGHWLKLVRDDVGDQIPIIGTIDAHANLSQKMIDSTDALIAYRTNPHLDQHERGVEAARLMARTIRGEVRPIQRAEFPPLAINIERQMTSEPHLAGLYGLADDALEVPGVLSNSVLLGFPYADVQEMGSATLVVTDGDADLASSQARQLSRYMLKHRQQFDGQLTSIDQALEKTRSMEGPICLLDMGDNVGGGAPGDSTHLAHAIRSQCIKDSLVCINDPLSAKQARQAGNGATIEMQIGGKTDHLHGQPLCGLFRVVGTYDGKFTDPEVRHGGLGEYDQGKSVIVRSADETGLTILITSNRTPPFSLVQLTSCGIDPAEFRLLVAKGVNAPVAAYEQVCKHFVRVNTPGCTTADMKQLQYSNRRRPMFPFEDA